MSPPIPPTPPKTSLAGQTVLITGGNAGLGFEAARQILILGAARVIITSRDAARGQAAVAALRADPAFQQANPQARIDVFALDLADYRDGLRFVQHVRAEVPALDVLLANAAQVDIHRTLVPPAAGGHERSMQVNVYTHLLVVLALLPLLVATARASGRPARLTFTGSALHATQETISKAPVCLEGPSAVLNHFDSPDHFSLGRYADTKLCLVAYTRTLAALVPDVRLLVINNASPGFVHTLGLDKNLPFYLRYPTALARRLLGRSVQDGAQALVYAAVEAGPETHGQYLENNSVHPVATVLDTVEGKQFAAALWQELVADCAKYDASLAQYAKIPAAL